MGKRMQSVGRLGPAPARHEWKVGDRVSFAASPAPENRSVYTGVVESIDGTTAYVRDDGWGAVSSVALNRLWLAGAFIVQPSGPRGVRYFDNCDICRKQLTQVDVDSNSREGVDALNIGFVCVSCLEHAAGYAL
jgi:hypothetical protein